MMYSSPVVPVTTTLLSRARRWNPFGPTRAPAMMSPSRCGTFILFNNSGAPRIMMSSSRNFSNGSSIGSERCPTLSKVIR